MRTNCKICNDIGIEMGKRGFSFVQQLWLSDRLPGPDPRVRESVNLAVFPLLITCVQSAFLKGSLGSTRRTIPAHAFLKNRPQLNNQWICRCIEFKWVVTSVKSNSSLCVRPYMFRRNISFIIRRAEQSCINPPIGFVKVFKR